MLTPSEIESNWEALLAVDVIFSIVAKHYEKDTQLQDKVVLGFKNAPAGKGVHHNYRGGLVQHILECLDFINRIHGQYPATDKRVMVEGVLLHDLHKAFYHFYEDKDGKFGYLDHALTKMYTPNQKTFLMISGGYCGDVVFPYMRISPHCRHIIECSEGGWAENAPKEASVEAKLVYLADEISVVHNRLYYEKQLSIYERNPDWFSFNLTYPDQTRTGVLL